MKSIISIMSFIKRQAANWLDFAPESAAVSSGTQALAEKRREIEKIDRAIIRRHVVGRDLQEAQRKRARLYRQMDRWFSAELAIVENKLRELRARFARFYCNWTGDPYTSEQQPAPIDEEIVKARGYRLAAIVAAAMEVMLVTYLMGEHYSLLVALPVALVTTVCLTIFLDKAIVHAALDDAPCRSLDLITRYAFWPALIVTAPALFFIAGARYVSGLPEFLSALFDLTASVATLIATPGLLILGGAMLALANLYGWSLTMSRAFEQLIRQHEDLVSARDEFLGELRAPDDDDAPRMPSTSGYQTTSFALVGLLVLSSFLTGCQATAGGRPEKVKPRPPAASPTAGGAILHFEIDRSRSVSAQACSGAATNLHRQLAPLIDAMQATEVEIRYFGDDGWSAPVVFSLALPRLQVPLEPDIGGGEFSRLPNRQKDQERHRQAASEAALKQARAQHQRNQAEALEKVSVDMLDPCVGAESPCTDVYGALSRISAGRRNVREVYVIVTDGYSTCQRSPLAPLAAPQGNVKVVVLLAAALAKEGEGKRPAEQFASRREVWRKVAPWAEIVPAFESNLSDYIRAEQPAATGNR